MQATRSALGATARLYQRVGARIIVALAFLGVLWAQLYFLLNSGFTARIFEAQVNTRFRGRIIWTRLSFGPLPWRLRVLEPQLIGADGQPVVTADAIHVDQIAWLDLLAGRIHLEAIRILRPEVRLVQREHPTERDAWGQPERVFNIEELFWPPERLAEDGLPPGGPPLDLQRADLIDGRCVVDLDGFSLDVRGLQISDARFSLADGLLGMGATRFAADQVRVRVPASAESVAPIREAPRDQVLEWHLRGLTASQFRWRDRAFGVDRLETRLHGGKLSLQGFGMQLDTPGLPEVTGLLRLQAPDIAPWLAQLGVTGLHGPVGLEARIKGELDALDGRLRLEAGPLRAYGYRADAVAAEIQVEALEHFTLEHLELQALGGQITAFGALDLGGAGALTLEAVGIDPSAVPPLGRAPLRALLAGRARLGIMARGTDLFGAGREASAAIRTELRRTGGPVFGLGSRIRLDSVARWAGDGVELSRLTVDAGTARIETQGSLDLAARDARLRWSLRIPELSPFGALVQQPVLGSVGATGTLSGPLETPRITARIRSGGLRWEALSADRLELDGSLDLATERLDVSRLTLTGPLGSVAGQGQVQLAGAQRISGRLDVRGVELARLPGLDLPVAGRLDARLRFGGRLRAPSLDGTARLVSPRYDRLTFDRLDLEAGWDGRQLTLGRLALRDAQGERLQASGRVIPSDRRFDGELRLTDFDLTTLNQLLPEPIPLRGRLSVSLGGAGRLQDPRGTGEVLIEDLAYGDLQLGDARLKLASEGQMVTLRGPLFGSFELDAALPTAPGPPGRVTLALTELAVERLVPAIDAAGVVSRISGAVSAYLTDGLALDTVVVELSALAAGLQIRDAQGQPVRAPGAQACADERPSCASVHLSSTQPVRLTYTHATQTAKVERLQLAGGGQRIGIEGEARPDWLALRLTGGLDLEALFPFLRQSFTEVEGALELDLNLSGPPSNPSFSGAIRLESAELIPRSPAMGGELHLIAPVVLEIQPPIGPVMPGPDGRLPQGLFTVDKPYQVDGRPNRFRLRRDDSEVEINLLSGDFVDFQPQSLRIGLATEEAELDLPRTLSAALRTQDTVFELWVDPRRPPDAQTRLRLAGHIDVLRGEYIADISSAADITRGMRDNLSGRRQLRQVSAFERNKLLRNLEVDLSVRGQDEIFVRNKITVLDLDLSVGLDLRRISGSLYPKGDTPLVIEGTVSVLDDSRITYARRPFDVTLGDVVFGAGNFVTANLVAAHTFRMRTDRAGQAGTFDRGAAGDVREEEVTLTARVVLDQLGSDPQMDLNLTSSSGASKIEVATLVLTGAYPSDLTGAAGASPATEVLLSPVLSLIEAPFEETLDVDLTLTPATTGTLFIDADKLLSRRLRLYSRTPVGDEAANNLQTFGLEYRLNNEVTGELTNEQLGNLNSTSGRLRFRLLID